MLKKIKRLIRLWKGDEIDFFFTYLFFSIMATGGTTIVLLLMLALKHNPSRFLLFTLLILNIIAFILTGTTITNLKRRIKF